MGERIRWFGLRLVEWLLDLPFVLGEQPARLRMAARAAHWRCVDAAADVRWTLQDGIFRARLAIRNLGAGAACPEADLESRRLADLRRELTGRQAEIGAEEIRLEARRQQVEEAASRLETREEALAQRMRELNHREADLEARRARADAERMKHAILRLELDRDRAALTPSVGPQGEMARRESEWWEKQLGKPGRRTSAAMASNRSPAG